MNEWFTEGVASEPHDSNCKCMDKLTASVSHSKKRINLPHFAFSRGCILIADIYTHYM